jgi:hypothetical protein
LILSAPVVVTLAPPMVEERAFLIEQVCEKADQVFTLEMPATQVAQLALL